MYHQDLADARAFDAFVLRTVSTLDARYGHGWNNRLLYDRLNIANPDECVVGQLEGNWNHVWPKMKDAGITETDVPALLPPEDLETSKYYLWYRQATAAWIRWSENQQMVAA